MQESRTAAPRCQQPWAASSRLPHERAAGRLRGLQRGGRRDVAWEHEGDRNARDILHRVAQQPPGRAGLEPADVHALAVALDDIFDYAEEAADQLGRYIVEARWSRPRRSPTCSCARAAEVELGLSGLRDGIDAGSHLAEVHTLRDEADRIVREAVASLFFNGTVVIRWKDIFESLEGAVVACEAAADIPEGLVLERHGR